MGPLELLLGAHGGHHLTLPPLAAQLSVKAGVPGWRRRGKAFASKWRPFESHLRPTMQGAALAGLDISGGEPLGRCPPAQAAAASQR